MARPLPRFWTDREPRERTLLLILAGLAALFILIFAVILPVQNLSRTAEADLRRAQADLRLVQRAAPQIGAGSGSRAAFDRSALIRAAGARNVKLARVQPGEGGALSVWVDDVQTDALYGLFEDLMTNYAASAQRVSINADQDGALSAQFTLRPE